jgi:acyl-CoA synthetase (AMP-forming)/AMP-acid ligase II
MNIAQHFFDAAKKHPNAIAIVDAKREVTFGELANEVQHLANGMTEMGIKRGDSVMVMIPFSIALYTHILAIFSLGAQVVLVDTLKPKKRVEHAFRKSECTFLLTRPIFKKLRFFIFPKALWRLIKVVKPQRKESKLMEVSHEDTALITFTSGTTGLPKAADRTHGFLKTQLETLKEELNLEEGQMHLTSLPVVLMCNLAYGTTSFIPPKYGHRNKWKSMVAGRSFDLISGSPHHVLRFLDRVHISDGGQVFVGGATILPHFIKALGKKVDLENVHLVYGSTEAEPITQMKGHQYLSWNRGEAGICVGETHQNIEVLINKVRAEGLEVLEEGSTGEVLVSGPHVLDKYYKDQEAFKQHKILVDGKLWHRTGDAGYWKAGRLYYMGRLRYVHQEEGKVFSPTVVEKILSREYGVEGTMLRLEERHVLFLEGNDLQTERITLPYSVDDVKYVNSFKRDKRHKSRIDYEELVRNYSNKS